MNKPAQYNPNLHQQSAANGTVSAQSAGVRHAHDYAEADNAFLNDFQKETGLEFLSVERDAHEYQRAARHSNKVRVLKIVLPVIGVLIMLGISAALVFNAVFTSDVSISSVSIDDGNLVMENPVLNGFDKDKRPFSLTAERAIQDVANPTRVELHKILAELPVDDTVSATIRAGTGIYDAELKTLQLDNLVEVETTTGLQLILDDADVDLSEGVLNTSGAVAASSPQADISANNLSVSDNANRIVFSGNVKMTLRPNESKKETQDQ